MPFLGPDQLWLPVGAALAGVILLVAWITSLRRALARRDRAEAESRALNATLEERVAGRTAELEKARNELDHALAQERDVNELKSRFIAMVSHEFRTPLGVTMSALELLRHHRARLPADKQEELLEDIFSSTLRMSGLMEQVLLLGRVEAGRVACRPAPVNLAELCGKLADESRSATNRREPIEVRCEGDLSDVRVDEGLVRHILTNLLSNAVKYSPEGSAIDFRARREGETVEFVVADQGIGIPEEDQPRLFEAFHRASNVGDISGTGLGLLLVKRCVEVHGGEIALRSQAGQGTAFTVRLPLTGA